jgi:hypothetical protein
LVIKQALFRTDDGFMFTVQSIQMLLIAAGSFVMFYIMLKAVGEGAAVMASTEITERRAREKKKREEDAAAEAAGRAAALEPLALNADGSVEEPILGVVEAGV